MKKIWNVAKKNRGNRKRKEAMAYSKYLPKELALLFLVVGMFFGILYSADIVYFSVQVEKKDTIQVTANYKSYKKWDIPGRPIDTDIFFSDMDRKEIRSTCNKYIDWNLLDKMKTGTSVVIRLHPNSHRILEMRSGKNYILRFEDAQIMPLWLLGLEYIFTASCYGIALYAIVKILRKEIS